jgi:hypothetical protein
MNEIDPNYFQRGKLYRNDSCQHLTLWGDVNGSGVGGELLPNDVFLFLDQKINKKENDIVLKFINCQGETKYLYLNSIEYESMVEVNQ